MNCLDDKTKSKRQGKYKQSTHSAQVFPNLFFHPATSSHVVFEVSGGGGVHSSQDPHGSQLQTTSTPFFSKDFEHQPLQSLPPVVCVCERSDAVRTFAEFATESRVADTRAAVFVVSMIDEN